MHLLVLGNEGIRKELLPQDKEPDLQITWISKLDELKAHANADLVIDLLFRNIPERVQMLQGLNRPVVVNSVTDTLKTIGISFVRINGWNTFLGSTLIESSSDNEQAKSVTAEAFRLLDKELCWVPDQAGFITARVISAIINEAYFALSEGVSTKEEINIAMKLGTNYPYGPFEWADRIGLKNVLNLLHTLSKEQDRYQPCPLLIEETKT